MIIDGPFSFHSMVNSSYFAAILVYLTYLEDVCVFCV